jgi:hypothetical protein
LSGTSTFSPTVSEENSAPSWNSTPVLRSIHLRVAVLSLRALHAQDFDAARVGAAQAEDERISTDLPVPEPPTTPRISPRPHVQVQPIVHDLFAESVPPGHARG